MSDLSVPPGPGVPLGLTVPAGELTEQFSHASGPGGQGVNTTDSRVQLSLDVAGTSALTHAQRARALTHLAPRLTGGVLTVTAAEYRSQLRNRKAARVRMASLLREALAPPATRRATQRTRGSQERRLRAKRSRAETKQNRRQPSDHA